MISVEDLKPLILHRNKKFTFPDVDKSNKHGNVVILTDGKEEGLDNFLTKAPFYNINWKSYFTDYRISLTVNKAKKIIKIPRKDKYDEVKKKHSQIAKTFYSVDKYKKANLIYDANPYFSFIHDIKQPKKKVKNYFDTLSTVCLRPDLSEYTNKFLIFNVKEVNVPLLKYIDKVDLPNQLSIILTAARYEPTYLEPYKDVQIILFSKNYLNYTTFKMSDIIETKSLNKLKSTISIMLKSNSLADDAPEPEAEPQIASNVANKLFGAAAVGYGLSGKMTNDFEKIAEEIREEKGIEDEKDLIEAVQDDERILKIADDIKKEKITSAKSRVSLARDEKLKKEMGLLESPYSGKKLNDIVKEINDKELTPQKFDVTTKNEDMKSSTINDFEKNYNSKQLEADRMALINSLSENKSIPMYLRKMEVQDSSDSFTKKETVTLNFEDSERVRHTVKFDLPTFVDDKFLYINGGKKSIIKQLTLFPIVKTSPDQVQVVSNYSSKMFVLRHGQKMSAKLERFYKFLAKGAKGINFTFGNNSEINKTSYTSLEYDELSSKYSVISIPSQKLELNFSQVSIEEKYKEISKKKNMPKRKEGHLLIGFKKDEPIFLNVDKNIIVGTNSDIVDFLMDAIFEADESNIETYSATNVPKGLMYTRVSILNKKIPIVVLLGYKEGLSELLKRAKIKHEFSPKRKNLTDDEKNKIGVVDFSDGHLYFDRYPLRNSLIMNGLHIVNTREFTLAEFDEKFTYLDIFDDLFGSQNISKGLNNFFELFLDPITLEVLKDFDLPTNFTDILIYANALLEDNKYFNENTMNIYRVRSNELINVYMYIALAEAYKQYKDAHNAGKKDVKMSIPQDKVLKEIIASPLLANYSVLNPKLLGL